MTRPLGLDPKNSTDAWINKGMALGILGDLEANNRSRYEEAIRAFDQAIRLDPKNSSQAWYNKGVALGDLGRLRSQQSKQI